MRTITSNFSNAGKVFDALQVNTEEAKVEAKKAGSITKKLKEGQEIVDTIFVDRIARWVGGVNKALSTIEKGKADVKDVQALVEIRDFLLKYKR